MARDSTEMVLEGRGDGVVQRWVHTKAAVVRVGGTRRVDVQYGKTRLLTTVEESGGRCRLLEGGVYCGNERSDVEEDSTTRFGRSEECVTVAGN